jgi:hypothetical protein
MNYFSKVLILCYQRIKHFLHDLIKVTKFANEFSLMKVCHDIKIWLNDQIFMKKPNNTMKNTFKLYLIKISSFKSFDVSFFGDQIIMKKSENIIF